MYLHPQLGQGITLNFPSYVCSVDKEILDLKLNEESLSMISSDKILGVFADQNLTWSYHIRHLSKKITSSI